jgi:hypothetical protein
MVLREQVARLVAMRSWLARQPKNAGCHPTASVTTARCRISRYPRE